MGGGNFLTQATPTNFHSFFTAKILTPSEKAEDYREVTPSEKAQLEAQDAKWVRPSDDLIKQWNTAWKVMGVTYGQYNEATGFFEGNYINDIGEDEARDILRYGYLQSNGVSPGGVNAIVYRETRTYLPVVVENGYLYDLLSYSQKVENVRLVDYFSRGKKINDKQILSTKVTRQLLGIQVWTSCKRVFPILQMSAKDDMNVHFYNCNYRDMEELFLHGICLPMTCFKTNTSLKLECWQYMITNSANTTAISIQVHPDVMAKLTDTNNAEWHQVLLDATAKNIQFIV